MKKIFPEKLKKGDEVRIIAPARSLKLLSEESIKIANQRFEQLGLKLSFGKNVNEADEFMSSTIESRIKDLHQAFSDKNVKAIFTVIGGFNSNQLLRYIDWELIRNNPKIFCGYSDITALNNAIFAKTGLVTYSGPHYSSLGQKLYLDYTLDYLKKCLMSDLSFEVKQSDFWTDDLWFLDQDKRQPIKNPGFLVINEGETEGTILGGNLNTFNLLQGTEYFPDLENSVLFIEDDSMSNAVTFDRDLQSLIHLPDFGKVRGIVIGRFQKASKITNENIIKIIKTKKELNNMPVVYGADFGHSDPRITFPIGGTVQLNSKEGQTRIKIIEH